MNKKKLRSLALTLVLVLGACVAWFLLSGGTYNNPALEQEPAESPEFYLHMEEIGDRVLDTDIVLPPGKLVVTRLRAEYEDGAMRLVIPRLELDTAIGGDTTLETLGRLPGLYKYAQIPNLYNTNVSIAAHRDLPGYEFYYLDTVAEGDFIYLIYQDKLFKYAYCSTEVIEKNDWNPIRVHYDSRVTLTTCTPLGTSKQRMVVTGELVEMVDYSEDYVFE